MVTGILAAIAAVFTAVTAWFGYQQRNAKSPQEKVDDAKKDIDEMERDFEKNGGRLGKKK
jgi:hypothetical protein